MHFGGQEEEGGARRRKEGAVRECAEEKEGGGWKRRREERRKRGKERASKPPFVSRPRRLAKLRRRSFKFIAVLIRPLASLKFVVDTSRPSRKRNTPPMRRRVVGIPCVCIQVRISSGAFSVEEV